MLERKRSNLESSQSPARQRRMLRSAAEAEAEAEALAKSTRRDDDPDRISELPDKILHHILSFLDMKHVIHTAFLSKRWTTIFKSLPSLNLDQNSYKNTTHGNYLHNTKFIDFVDRVLGLRDSSSDDNNNFIRSLCITWFDKKMDLNRVTTWIDFAIRHNVQDLEFTLGLGLPGNLFELRDHPISLFNCKLLTTLKLGSKDYSEVIIPQGLVVDLPKLKILHLEHLYFHGEKINENFFSRCPVMERLIITHCQLQGNTLNIVLSENHPLKYLKIDSLDKYLGINRSFHITISAPKLTSLSIRDVHKTFGDYNLVNMHSLVQVRIISYEEDSKNQLKFLNGISYVKSLSLSAAAVEKHAWSNDLLILNPFHNLRVLKLLIHTSFERNETCTIAYLLRNCPNVVALVLKMSLDHPHVWGPLEYTTEYGGAFRIRPEHLRFIEIRGFTGCPNQFDFLYFMLRRTPWLEKVFIFAHKKHLTSQNKEICRAMFYSCPRISSKAELFFLPSLKDELMYDSR